MHRVFEPISLGPLHLRNRIIKTATYEGMVAQGRPSASLLRHHLELARGGVGMTTLAYCSVSPDGRTFENQLVMHAGNVGPLRVLTQAVQAEGARVMLQLGHAGGFTKNGALEDGRGPFGPSYAFNAYGLMKGKPLARPMSLEQIERTVRDFAHAAVLAREAGFDAVELHAGHGYLLSQFLSPHRNHRGDHYGGCLENRARFTLEVVDAVRAAVGPEYPVFVKLNLDDGVPGGLTVSESAQVARWLEEHGASAIVLSGGFVSHNALFLLRGQRPLRQMIEVETNLLQKAAIGVFGPVLVPEVPYRPLFFLEAAKVVRAAVRLPLVLLGGVTSRADLERTIDEGFELVAMGRALIHDPEHVARLMRGEVDRSGCVPCNVCITEMDRPGGVCCARVAAQLARRAREVHEGLHETTLTERALSP